MPTLNWIGKEAVINHHLEVPFHLLKDVPELGCGDPGSGNLIVEGDNLVALKALLPYYAGRVKCICIDPPYNTGNEGWAYNDNVNSPAIRKWIGDTVGGEGETLDRHDRWLCMMYPRLALLMEFLSEDGSIWISMDDSEIALLRVLMDEVFGRERFVACNVWQKRYSRENRGAIGDVHDYIVVYAKNPDRFQEVRNLVPLTEEQSKIYKNPNDDPQGRWRGIPMTAQGYRPNQMYDIVGPDGTVHRPPEGRCWSTIEPEFLKLKAAGRIWFGKDGKTQPNIIRYLSEVGGMVPWTWWPHEEVGHTDESRKEVQSIFHTQTAFDTPKPTRLIERILQIATNPGDLVLDSFAGSGTTGHAVLKMNASGRVGVPPAGSGILPERTSERAKPLPDHERPSGGTPASAGGTPTLPGTEGARYTRRRRLPHFEHPWAIYALTITTAGKRTLHPASRTIVLDALRHFHGQRYEIFAACVMPDHVHLLLQPWIKEQNDHGETVFWPLSELMHSIKSFTAKAINKAEGTQGTVWEQERFDRYVRGDRDLEEKFRYIVENPIRAGLGEEYPWVWDAESGADARGSGDAEGGAEVRSGRMPEPAGGTPTLPETPRRFILVEMEPKIAQDITRERVRRVAEGYTNAKAEAVPGLGGGFRYVRLGDELFDEHGRINETKVRFADLARHVYFSETGEPLPRERIAKTPLLGVHHGRAVYLLYNGILKDRSVDGGNVLTRTTLDLLPAHDGPRVVYAAGSRFSKARLEREGIVFKQTPYAIRTK